MTPKSRTRPSPSKPLPATAGPKKAATRPVAGPRVPPQSPARSAAPATTPKPPVKPGPRPAKAKPLATPRTLPAAVAPVLVGTAVVRPLDGPALIPWRFLCAMGVALCVQIATNYANDYSDGKRGVDDPGERVGPPRLVGNEIGRAACRERV